MSKAAELAALIANVNKGSSLAAKNLFINGGMDVSQRSTSEASQTTVDGYVCADRWSIQLGSSGTFTISQSTDVPSGYGFSNSTKFDCTTADASPNYGLIRQRFEGQNVQVLNKGTSSAVPVTLSFWVKSNLTGNFQVNLQDIDTSGSRHIGATYSISSANTWEKKEITFAGDTTGALDNDNAASFNVEWWLAAGSTYNSGSVPTSWAAEANGNRAAGLNVSIGSSTSNDFYITGCQLEIGEKATEFEHEPFETTLRKASRYYSQIDRTDNQTCHIVCYAQAAQVARAGYHIPMRTAPSITETNFNLLHGAGSEEAITSVDDIHHDEQLVSFRLVCADNLTVGQAVCLYSNGVATLTFDAEL
jgi:hypothetical protein